MSRYKWRVQKHSLCRRLQAMQAPPPVSRASKATDNFSLSITSKIHFYGESPMWQVAQINKITVINHFCLYSFIARSSLPTVWAMLTASEPLLAWYTPRDGFRVCAQGKSVQNRTADWMITKAGEYLEIAPTIDLENACLLHSSGVVQIVTNDLDTLIYRFDLASQLNSKSITSIRVYWY